MKNLTHVIFIALAFSFLFLSISFEGPVKPAGIDGTYGLDGAIGNCI